MKLVCSEEMKRLKSGRIFGWSAEAEKNKLAESTLHRLMMHTVWMNIHLAPIPLFEIRVADGYGARWLADGSQVLYFHNNFERTQPSNKLTSHRYFWELAGLWQTLCLTNELAFLKNSDDVDLMYLSVK